MSGQNIFSFAFVIPPNLPKVLPKITRADMQIHLPRLDDPCLDETGLPSPTKKQALDVLIAKYRAVYALGGQITDTKATKGKGDEPGVRFVGKFKALVNPLFGGAWFVSGRCHVPKFFEEILFTEFVNARKSAQGSDQTPTLEFLIGVGLKPPMPGKPSITGYEWTVEPLVDMSAADDPVDLLFSRAKERAALAAPAPTEGESTPVVSTATASVESAPQPEVKETRGRNHRGSHAS